MARTTKTRRGLGKAILVIALMVTLASFYPGTWVLGFLWWLIVPDVFAGAVTQGFLPARLTMEQALKIVYSIEACGAILFFLIWVSHLLLQGIAPEETTTE